MDHLPLPHGASWECLSVPYISSNYSYDLEGVHGFGKFDVRSGFDFTNGKDKHSHTESEIVGFIQAWLYFGLLEEWVQQTIPRQKLLRGVTVDEVSTECVSSRALLEEGIIPLRRYTYGNPYSGTHHLDGGQMQRITRIINRQEWKKECEDFDNETRRLLTLVSTAYSVLERIDRAYHASAEPLPTVLLSIRILIHTLRSAAIGLEPQHTPDLFTGAGGETAAANRLRREMVAKGWCASQIKDLLDTLPSPLLVYLSQIRRIHRKGITHDGCSEGVCVAFNVRADTYKTRHVEEGCDCPFISVPAEELIKIVADGDIPLISINRNDKDITLSVQPASALALYVAVSHVWSDGLGNTYKNSLPRCQLDRLDKLLTALPEVPKGWPGMHLASSSEIALPGAVRRSKLFWLDTLCIPGAPSKTLEEEQKTERKRLKRHAINLIPLIFASTPQTLVLDSELMRISPDECDWVELAVRLLYAVWSGRCWTLEEWALCQICQLQCRDRAFEPFSRDNQPVATDSATGKSLWAEHPPGADDRLYIAKFNWRIMHILARPISGVLADASFRNFISRPRDYWMEDTVTATSVFVRCWNELARRQTSRAGDRLLILANLLGLDASEIANSERPMEVFLSTQPGIPLQLLFDQEPKAKNTDVCNRWIPKNPTMSTMPYVGEFMTWHDGFLYLKEASGYTQLLWVDDLAATNTHELELSVGSQYVYRVEFIRPPEVDCLPASHGAIGACIAVERSSLDGRPVKALTYGANFRGACLQVVHKATVRPTPSGDTRPKCRITAIYDCPVRIFVERPVESRSGAGSTPTPCREIPRWSLKLRQSCQRSPNVILQRQNYFGVLLFCHIVRYALQMPYYAMTLSCFYTVSTSLIKSFSGPQPRPPKLPMLLYLGMSTFVTPGILAPIAYGISKYSLGPLTRPDVRFIAITIARPFWSLLADAVWGKYIVIPCHSMWIATFGAQTPPAWEKSIDKILRIMPYEGISNLVMEVFILLGWKERQKEVVIEEEVEDDDVDEVESEEEAEEVE